VVDGNLLDDGEPESGAVGGRGVAGVEHVLAVGRGNPRPVVDDGEPHRLLALVTEPHLDGHVRSGVFDRVAEQILEQLSEP